MSPFYGLPNTLGKKIFFKNLGQKCQFYNFRWVAICNEMLGKWNSDPIPLSYLSSSSGATMLDPTDHNLLRRMSYTGCFLPSFLDILGSQAYQPMDINASLSLPGLTILSTSPLPPLIQKPNTQFLQRKQSGWSWGGYAHTPGNHQH